MSGDFKKIAEALFHIAQIYELCITSESFEEDELYRDVLLDLAGKLTAELRDCVHRLQN